MGGVDGGGWGGGLTFYCVLWVLVDHPWLLSLEVTVEAVQDHVVEVA